MRAVHTMLVALTLTLAGCVGPNESRSNGGGTTVHIAGSSTVLPVAQAWAEEFEAANPETRIVVAGGGTGAGFKQFCNGEIDVSDASRPIKTGPGSETETCAANGVDPFEIKIAIDGLAVVVAKSNTFVDHLTVAELHRIWTADPAKQANRWSDLRPAWPQEEIARYGPGTDSGTFDYFVEVVIQPTDGKESKGRSDYTPSEDDNVLVQGVRASPYALGYFGLAYAEANADSVRTIPIDGGQGAGPIAPTRADVEAGRYAPLARPIFMYTDGAPTGAVREYLEFGLSVEGQELVAGEGYVPLPAAERAAMLAKVQGN